MSKVGFWWWARAMQVASMVFVLGLVLCVGGTFLLSLSGLLPRLEVPLVLSDGSVREAGLLLHGAAFALTLLLLAYMPANWRILALETSHRSFRMRMEDVANAYWAAHRADRTGVFNVSSEYDAVRERLIWLKEHPDLGHLDADLLEVAAQMSRVSEGLAERYSDEAVARARDSLEARQREADQMEVRIARALEVTRDLRQWKSRVEIEEDVAVSRMNQLIAELDTLTEELGLSPVRRRRDPQVLELPQLPRPRPAAVPAE
ncbi:DNA repair protein [Silicimonas algicola]|uniref:DNA repair protein n=1 Tax=Silicimonas algicola TaxID=1826607 RepID=A0A316G4X5_9RHOB|nr:DNA repair protein [Silicimonas algicola]AZQ68544.1 DNA repair protein [Silicimonas algicola]PWK55743.1 hypothetical protein C8D95_106139 [Silicimonas algicola]